MAAVPENDVSVMETLKLPSEEMHSTNLQATNGEESVEQLQKNPLNDVKAEEEQVVKEEETQQSTNDQDSMEKRKRGEDQEEEENGEAKKARHPMWKTSLCSFFRQKGAGICSHGESCRYAHSEEELQQRPDKSWDPTSERVKKLMKLENEEKVKTLVEAREDVYMPDAIADSIDPSLEKCLVHLPQKWTTDNLKSFLDEQGLVYLTAKKKKGMTVGFVSFETADQVKALEGMDGKSFRNKHIKVADVIPRSFEKKTKSTNLVSEDPDVSVSVDEFEDGDTVEKDDSTVLASAPKARSVRDAVTPLAHMSYSDQLEHKKSSLAQNLKRLTRNARKACPDGVPLPGWVLNSREIGGLPCKLEGIIESPLVHGYRNKCEFSVGYSVNGKQTVGFMLGNFREGVTAVEEPLDCPNVSKISCQFASLFQDFLRQSELPVWNRINNSGFWRQLTVREGRSADQAVKIECSEANISEVMVMVQVCSVGFNDETIANELQKMAQAFAQGASASSPPLPLTSLVVQDHTGISNVAPADAPLKSLCIPKGESTSAVEAVNNAEEAMIHDYISNLRFRISPTAFFQVNTLAAEKLYSLAGDWAGLGPDTLLFDVCCGTGTIGLTLAHRVGMVVGIEMNASAVSDANRNAELNNITNCRFVCAKAEDVMGSLLKEYVTVPLKQEPTSLSESTRTEEGDIRECATADKLELESLIHDNDDVKSLPGCPEISGEEVKEPVQKNCISEDQNSRNDKQEQQFKNVVAIVDPPRAGLHPTVIKALRTHPSLRRLVYISCNPESLVANAIELCTPSADKTNKGNTNNRGWKHMSSAGLARQRAKSMPNSEPFRPIKAVAVDLFPHTPHCETVMLMESDSINSCSAYILHINNHPDVRQLDQMSKILAR